MPGGGAESEPLDIPPSQPSPFMLAEPPSSSGAIPDDNDLLPEEAWTTTQSKGLGEVEN